MIHSDHDPSLSSDGLQCRQYGNRYPSLNCKVPLIPNSIFVANHKNPQTNGIEGHLSAESSRKKNTWNTVFPLQCKSNHPWVFAHPHPFHQNAHPRYGSTTPLPRESHWSCIPPERFWRTEKVELSPFLAWISSCTMFYPFFVSYPFL